MSTKQKNNAPSPSNSKQLLPLKSITNDPFFIVGMGASAGGLDALENFFQNMPNNSKLAFVIITHLDPNQISLMPELIQKQTEMPVFTIEDGLKVQPNSIYIVPPNKDVGIINGTLQLIDPIENYGFRLPIDYFFKTLAADQKEKAICIILSGMGTDGTLGLKAIKEELGMVMVHDPEVSKYNGMPQSAIETGLVDFICFPENMPDQLAKYIQHTTTLIKRNADKINELSKASTDIMQKIFIILRTHTGHDFSQYKKNTIYRRIERRMNIHQISSIANYFKYLQQNLNEVNMLFKDLLIGVTRFFRDTPAFDELSNTVFPNLFKNKPADYNVRMWIPGCSTGEEAYSIGIILKEFMNQHQFHFSVQIFATDLDSDAIEIARTGVYPANIASDVSKKYLNRYFTKQDNSFLIKKEIREMIVFAPQDIIKDPPFTRLDLISCRNFLIYLDNQLQKKLMPLFHYSLHPNGILFLGTSETIGGFMDLFSVIDKKWKIFERKPNLYAKHEFFEFPISSPVIKDVSNLPQKVSKVTKAQLLERILLRDIVPACALINEKAEVLYIHGRTGKYLEPTQGEFRSNIFDMARKGLKFELSSAIRKALSSQKKIICEGVNVKTNGNTQMINLIVIPLNEPDTLPGQLLVIFEDSRISVKDKQHKGKQGKKTAYTVENVQKIEAELQYTRENLQTTIEELETSNEELKSTNEELQSTNEELQSANEELETSREEQQSLNEELQTVNSELQKKIDELSSTNNDMKNLLNSLEIPTVFLDNNLCVKRFTSHISEIMNLIPSDIGRSINDIVIKLNDAAIVDEAKKVLNNLVFREKETQTHNGHWYLMRILPYRTMDNVIDGVVVTFINITDQKSAVKKIELLNTENQDARDYAESIIETLRESILILDKEMKIVFANKSFYKRFHVLPDETLGKKLYDLGNRQWDIPELRKLIDQVIPENNTFENFEVENHFPAIGLKKMILNARKIVPKGSGQEKILLAIEAL
ncbi:MAG: PAS domain-containing protein [Candidatus Magnetomorum sp.]|nr:PAS domain-containing protein [Candidatus Magnetomorum sp.]